MKHTFPNDSLFQFVKTLSKAEKRNFRLYATRQISNKASLFISLFDILDDSDSYNEEKIREKLNITKSQLSNIKNHLYNQLLISCRLLQSKHSKQIELREQIDFANILYNKGLLKQSLKILEKAKKTATTNEFFIIAIEIVEMEKKIELLYNTKYANNTADILSVESNRLTKIVDNINFLSNITIQLYGLYIKLGFARSDRDIKLLETVFAPRINSMLNTGTTKLEFLHLYNSQMWYSYIRYDFVNCYKYSSKIAKLYNDNDFLLNTYHDIYLKAVSRKMESLYLLGRYNRLTKTMKSYEDNLPDLSKRLNESGQLTAEYILYVNKVNTIFTSGQFSKNLLIIKDIEFFIKKCGTRIGTYEKILLHYKIASMYFGVGDYDKCVIYLQKIISVKNNVIRRDILCFARILNLIATYESGNDRNLDKQIKNVYTYLIKMNDMHTVQREMMAFIKKLNYITIFEVRKELKKLYDKLKPYEGESYEQRPFIYMDILSWLQSKIENKSFETVMQEKFIKKIQNN